LFSLEKIVLTAVLSAGCLVGCTSIYERVDRKDLKVSVFWAQDTLSFSNVQFRKVNRMTPVVYKKTIVVGNALEGLISYDLDTKNVKWKLPVQRGVEASAVAVRDTLFVGGLNGIMHSINMANGSVNWTFDTKAEIVSEPILQEGIVYFMAGSQSIYALDGLTGKQIWIYSRQDTSNSMTIRGGSKPAIQNGILYVGFSDGSLVAINSQTGTEQWEITLNRNSKFKDIDSSPVITDECILLNSYDDKIYCISKDKGEIVWSSAFGGASTPLVIDQQIYTTSSKGELVSLNKKDGSLFWKIETKNGVFVDPIQFNDLIVSGESQGKLIFFDRLSGKSLGSFEPGRGVFSRPVAVENNLYFISGEANLYGVNAEFQDKASIYYLK
jgi:outer membrane protein assembly factor BamB